MELEMFRSPDVLLTLYLADVHMAGIWQCALRRSVPRFSLHSFLKMCVVV
jgi:hypothetical protein